METFNVSVYDPVSHHVVFGDNEFTGKEVEGKTLHFLLREYSGKR